MKRIPPTRAEIRDLLAIARRELADAHVQGLSAEGSFEHAYAAPLALATAVVRSEGERVHGADHHRLTFERLAKLANQKFAETADYLQHCRRRRNVAVYDRSGVVSEAESVELRTQMTGLMKHVEAWLREEHGELWGDEP